MKNKKILWIVSIVAVLVIAWFIYINSRGYLIKKIMKDKGLDREQLEPLTTEQLKQIVNKELDIPKKHIKL